jgi:hypothetical protein
MRCPWTPSSLVPTKADREAVRYDAFLSRGGAERRVVVDIPNVLEESQEFRLAREVYKVTAIHAGHDDFDAVLEAELIGDAPDFAVGTAE